MRILDAQQTAAALPWQALIDALKEGFKNGCETPLRHQHQFEIPNESDGTLLLMPAWTSGEYLGVKQILVIPDNAQRNISAVTASYQLSSASTGELLAVMEGNVLTHRRTAAASALASSYLSKTDSAHLLMVGTGGLAPSLIKAHATARPIERVSIWGRNPEKASALAKKINAHGIEATAITELKDSAAQADIISCATLSEAPLIFGDWLSAGTHVDLVGAFKPTMRESDDELMKRASIFVDTREGALSEAGDLVQPLNDGTIKHDNILAELQELTKEQHPGRSNENEITVFKSVGTGLEDLAAAVLAFQSDQ